MNLHKPNHDTFTHLVVFYDHETETWHIDPSDTTARYPEGNTSQVNFDPVLCEAKWFTNFRTNEALTDELAELIGAPKL